MVAHHARDRGRWVDCTADLRREELDEYVLCLLSRSNSTSPNINLRMSQTLFSALVAM